MEKMAKILLNLAESEINCAIGLYCTNHAKSLYLFQQAVEKAYKATGLLTGHICVEELKDIGHDYVRLLKRTMKLYANIEPEVKCKVAAVFDPSESNNIENDFEINDNLKRSDFFIITGEKLLDILSMISRAKGSLLDKGIDLETTQNILFFSKEAEKGALESITNIDEFSKDELQMFMKSVSEGAYYGMVLNILGLITSPHSETTRYPFINDAILVDPNGFYTINLPLIKNQMDFMLLGQEAIQELNKVFQTPF